MPKYNPASSIVIIPTHDGNVCAGLAGALVNAGGLYGGVGFSIGTSVVALARNIGVHMFLSHPALPEWVWLIDADIQFSREDMEIVAEGDELIVCAEYAKKTTDASEGVNKFGLGFTRVHRDVFRALDNLHYDPETGGTTKSPMKGCDPLIARFDWRGQTLGDYFPCGVQSGQWVSEDWGFFHLCRLAGIATRLENRTRLVHWGRMGFNYVPPAANQADMSLPQEG